jgi:predicted DNA-binding protein
MSRKKVSTTIYITPEQAERLKLLHERTKVPIAVYIREGIDMMLKHYEHVLPGQMTLDTNNDNRARSSETAEPRSHGGSQSDPRSHGGSQSDPRVRPAEPSSPGKK